MDKANAGLRGQRIINILMTVDFIFYLGLFLIMKMRNFRDFRLLFMYPAFGYPLSVLIWVGLFIQIISIFMDKEAGGRDVIKGLFAVIILAILSPQVFILWKSLLEDPGLIFTFISNKFIMSCIIITRCLEPIYLLLAGPGKKNDKELSRQK